MSGSRAFPKNLTPFILFELFFFAVFRSTCREKQNTETIAVLKNPFT